MSTPYLSIVATSRNDGHGGNMLERMQLFVNALVDQCDRHRLSAEIVLVEWNPPEGRPRLARALRWPKSRGGCDIRIIEVPNEIHRRFEYSDALPLFQMPAKNVGIRRARGRFVLATNIDILLSEELAGFLASSRLKAGRLYRVDRHDVPFDIPGDATVRDQLEHCRGTVIRKNDFAGSLDLRTGTMHWINPPLSASDRLSRLRRQIKPSSRTPPARIHTNASGDFSLMARQHWHALRGYPELAVLSTHVDSLLCFMAHHGPARVTALDEPMVAYHIEHGRSEGDTSVLDCHRASGEDASRSVPRLDHLRVVEWASSMRRARRAMQFNGEGWGLADDRLSESSPYG